RRDRSSASNVILSPITATWCFFFQAEDGIRDGHVTGVQTCVFRSVQGIKRVPDLLADGTLIWDSLYTLYRMLAGFAFAVILGVRSEERRVGKECRSRLSLFDLEE